METKTIVRVGDHLAEFTPLGWKSDDRRTAFFCSYAGHSGVPLPWHPNKEQAYAEQLLEVCRQRHIDAEIISVGGYDGPYTDPEFPNAKF
jgi:hypothetical protein